MKHDLTLVISSSSPPCRQSRRNTIVSVQKRSQCLVWITLSLLGCSIAPDDDAAIEVNATGAGAQSVPGVSWEEFKENARFSRKGRDVYLVETDMLITNEDELWNIYADRYLDVRDKSIVNVVSGVRDIRSTPTAIRYCFAAGWGGPVDCPGLGCYTAPALAAVQTSIQQAADSWELHTNVNFVHAGALDGAGCNTDGLNPGVDFVIQHYNNTSTAVGPFPSNSWSNQELLVPTGGIGRILAIHELGHALGLRHEHTHNKASPRCAEGSSYEELTGFDTLSCMKYSDCTAGNFINGTEISALDGIGTRMLYGAPARWLPVYATVTR